MSPRSSSWARLSKTAGRTIQWASGLVVDQVAHGPELRFVGQLGETLARPCGRGKRQPRRDRADPVVLCRLGEELVGVGVGAAVLDEDRARDAARVEQWRELVGLERPGDRFERGGQPALWRPLEVPQVMMCVDDREELIPGSCIHIGSFSRERLDLPEMPSK